jgi:hypothetical protein
MVVFYLVYLVPSMILEGKHKRLDVPSWMLVKSINKQSG